MKLNKFKLFSAGIVSATTLTLCMCSLTSCSKLSISLALKSDKDVILHNSDYQNVFDFEYQLSDKEASFSIDKDDCKISNSDYIVFDTDMQNPIEIVPDANHPGAGHIKVHVAYKTRTFMPSEKQVFNITLNIMLKRKNDANAIKQTIQFNDFSLTHKPPELVGQISLFSSKDATATHEYNKCAKFVFNLSSDFADPPQTFEITCPTLDQKLMFKFGEERQIVDRKVREDGSSYFEVDLKFKEQQSVGTKVEFSGFQFLCDDGRVYHLTPESTVFSVTYSE